MCGSTMYVSIAHVGVRIVHPFGFRHHRGTQIRTISSPFYQALCRFSFTIPRTVISPTKPFERVTLQHHPYRVREISFRETSAGFDEFFEVTETPLPYAGEP